MLAEWKQNLEKIGGNCSDIPFELRLGGMPVTGIIFLAAAFILKMVFQEIFLGDSVT